MTSNGQLERPWAGFGRSVSRVSRRTGNRARLWLRAISSLSELPPGRGGVLPASPRISARFADFSLCVARVGGASARGSILDRCGMISVIEVREGHKIERGRVYVAPSDAPPRANNGQEVVPRSLGIFLSGRIFGRPRRSLRTKGSRSVVTNGASEAPRADPIELIQLVLSDVPYLYPFSKP